MQYQHVSCGQCHNYIITCPGIAKPSDAANSLRTYPCASIYPDMTALGFDLMQITRAHAQRQVTRTSGSSKPRDVLMKVGISSGCAAAVVLGKCRRFYWCVKKHLYICLHMPAENSGCALCSKTFCLARVAEV